MKISFKLLQNMFGFLFFLPIIASASPRDSTLTKGSIGKIIYQVKRYRKVSPPKKEKRAEEYTLEQMLVEEDFQYKTERPASPPQSCCSKCCHCWCFCCCNKKEKKRPISPTLSLGSSSEDEEDVFDRTVPREVVIMSPPRFQKTKKEQRSPAPSSLSLNTIPSEITQDAS